MECKLPLVVLLIVAVCQSRAFQNPILENIQQGRVILYDNLYYMAAKDDQYNVENWLPIYVSADLQSWVRISYAFNVQTKPTWTYFGDLDHPFIHYADGIFYLFHGGFDFNTANYQIGVAKSRNITGPYVPESKPLYISTSEGAYYPTIIMDNGNGNTHLIWTDTYYTTLSGQMINLANLTFTGGPPTQLLSATLPWEGYIEVPNVVYRNGYYYIFYTGGDYCSYDVGIGVARSRSPLGEYEKLGNPIIGGSMASVPSVIKDPNGSSDAILYQTSCSPPTTINASTLVWGSDDWPQVVLS